MRAVDESRRSLPTGEPGPAGRSRGLRRAAAALAAVAVAVGAWQLTGDRSDPAATEQLTPWRGALLGPDGRGLLLAYGKGCAAGPDRVVVTEDTAAVRVSIVQRPPRSGGCASSYQPATIAARLPGPLGGRRLLDALTGEEHRPVAAGGVLRPGYLPYGVPLAPTAEEPTAETGPSGWQRSYGPTADGTSVLIQQAPAAAAPRRAQLERVAGVSVGGRPAVLWTRRDGGGEYVLQWTAGGWARSVSVVPVGPAAARSVGAELVRVAESLR